MSAQTLRVILIILVMLGMGALGANWIGNRERITRRTRRASIWIYGILLGIAYAVGDALARNLPLNHAIYWQILCFIGLIGALMWHPSGDGKLPPDDDSLGQKFIDLLTKEKERRKRRNR